MDRFNDEWKKLLRHYGLVSFHMVRMARLSQKIGSKIVPTKSAEQRIKDLTPFADCINEYLEAGIISAWDVEESTGTTIDTSTNMATSHG